jgi:VCBS repeat-containing protein
LTDADIATGDNFGFSVAVSGNWALVGAYGDDDNGRDSGSAYFFYIGEGGTNHAPDAGDDTASTPEDTPLVGVAPGVLANDTDPDAGDTLTVTDFDGTSALGATVTVNPDGSYSYDPTGSPLLRAVDDGETLDDTFTYTVTDSGGHSDTATVTITVVGIPGTPEIGSAPAVDPVNEGEASDPFILTAYDTDNPNADEVHFVVGGNAIPGSSAEGPLVDIQLSDGVLTPLGYVIADGSGGYTQEFTFTPHDGPADISIQYSFASTPPDGGALETSDPATLGISALNVAPNFSGPIPDLVGHRVGPWPFSISRTDPIDLNDYFSDVPYDQPLHFSYSLDGGAWVTVADYSASNFVLQYLGQGSHDLTIRASDGDDYTYSNTIEVTSDGAVQPPWHPVPPRWGWWGTPARSAHAFFFLDRAGAGSSSSHSSAVVQESHPGHGTYPWSGESHPGPRASNPWIERFAHNENGASAILSAENADLMDGLDSFPEGKSLLALVGAGKTDWSGSVAEQAGPSSEMADTLWAGGALVMDLDNLRCIDLCSDSVAPAMEAEHDTTGVIAGYDEAIETGKVLVLDADAISLRKVRA